MMVKNEEKIIKRCLESVKDIIDYYIISDTGSTDNTKEIIRKYFEENKIKGEIYDHEWENYGINRTKLLNVSKKKGDYLLLVDADYIINVYDTNYRNKLDKDCYKLKWEGNLDYKNIKLVRGDIDWEYKGVTHEYIINKTKKRLTQEVLEDLTISEYYDGSNRKDKFKRDIELLENEILKNETCEDISRYYFYLARSYEDLAISMNNDIEQKQNYINALKNYEKRINLGGWNEEIYYSMWKIGLCKIKLNYDLGNICEQLLKAYEFRPSRIEAIHELVKYFRINKMYHIGYIMGCKVLEQKYPNSDILFIQKDIYDYKLKDEVSICAYYYGNYQESKRLNDEILNLKNLPENVKKRIIINNELSIKKINSMI